MRDAIYDYLMAIRQEGKSSATVTQYGWHLVKMTEWLAAHDIARPREVTRRRLREWGAAIRDKWRPATVKQAVSAARSFFRWLSEEEGWEADPGRALAVPRVPVRLQRTLSADEIAVMLAACDTGDVMGLRMGAMISLLLDSGVRAAELCRLDRDDLDKARGVIKVLGKGGGERQAYFGMITGKRLEIWLDVRPVVETEAVFVSLGGGTPGCRLTTRGLRIILRRFGQKVGVKDVCPHAFRRAFACISTEAGAPSRVVMGAGGWSNIRMVERYTQGLRAERLYRQYSPADYLARLKP